ncbi:MAG: hypothetical protein GY749_14415 [Desulfobacteraceae bacterium]|nr:hypothetical protein [Desulfobacteraceae bacterium]
MAEYTKAVKISVDRMVHLTDQLYAYASGGKYQAETVETLSVGDFVEKTMSLLSHTIDPDICVDINLPRDILYVKADPTQIQIVISAVITNATEAIKGKGNIRVTCKNEIITDKTSEILSGLTPRNYVTLTITDDGKGMDKETAERVFEPFFSTNFMGRGLGMAAVQGIVRNHDGRISVDSELGRGTSVKICLPAVEKSR